MTRGTTLLRLDSEPHSSVVHIAARASGLARKCNHPPLFTGDSHIETSEGLRRMLPATASVLWGGVLPRTHICSTSFAIISDFPRFVKGVATVRAAKVVTATYAPYRRFSTTHTIKATSASPMNASPIRAFPWGLRTENGAMKQTATTSMTTAYRYMAIRAGRKHART